MQIDDSRNKTRRAQILSLSDDLVFTTGGSWRVLGAGEIWGLLWGL